MPASARLFAAALCTALLGLAACDTSPNGGIKDDLRDLAAERRQTWEAQNIDDYVFVYERLCDECPDDEQGPFEVFVRSAVLDSAAVGGQPVAPGLQARLFTIDGLFEFIEASFEAGPDRTSLLFDPDRGYPVSIFFDFDASRGGDEQIIDVSRLTIL